MNLQSQDTNGIRLITVDASRIDAAAAIQFKDQMRELTEASPPRVLLDLTQVEFLDSSGLGAVVAAMKQLGHERSLELCGLTQTVKKVFRLTRMDSVFVIHDSVSVAVEQAQAS